MTRPNARHPITKVSSSSWLRHWLLLLPLACVAAPVQSFTINFENLAIGEVLSNQYAATFGATFTPNAFTGPGSSTSGKPWATNTGMQVVSSTGGDVGPLGDPSLVYYKILRSFGGFQAENGDPSFRMTLSTPASSCSATFAGVQIAADVRMYFYGAGNGLLGTVAGTTEGQFVLSFNSGTPIASVNFAPGNGNDWVGVDNITCETGVAAPVLASVVSRKVHGSVGTFNLPLSANPNTPTTEPRMGPNHVIVFTFDKPVTAGTATVTEGTATAAAPTFSGNEMRAALSAVTNARFVTLNVANVVASDGSTGGSGSVRLGFLQGDVSQNRVVSLADVGAVNAQLAQSVTPANYLTDINASGTLSVADKVLTSAVLTTSLPAP